MLRRADLNRGCPSDVWFMTKSMMTRMPVALPESLRYGVSAASASSPLRRLAIREIARSAFEAGVWGERGVPDWATDAIE